MWCWSKLSAAQWEDAWTERLAGNPNAVMTYLKGGKTIRIEVFCEVEEDAVCLKEYFGGTVREVKSEDWIAKQAVQNRPLIKVRDRLLVTDKDDAVSIEKLKAQYPKRGVISIPAEMAFGTGDHATTSTCMRLMTDVVKMLPSRDWEMLDVGCGTGILGIAARLLGAQACAGFDFDGIAVDVSQKNVVRNGVDRVDFFQADVFEWSPEGDKQWDLVVANLFSTILQKAFVRIVPWMKADGYLVISGILATQWDETKVAAEAAGIEFLNVVKRGKWVTAMGHKKP